MKHTEHHRSHRIGWLRAAVLGANDGIVSTASLIVGVAAADSGRSGVLVAGVAGLVAGAMSMAAGEYVSVSSQADTERADLDREREELATDPKHERAELAAIYVTRGLDVELADQVAGQLMDKDALGAHARDELGISETLTARPVQAGAGRSGLGQLVRRRRRYATSARAYRACLRARVVGGRQFPALSCFVRFAGGAGRGLPGAACLSARHLLGCPGDGPDCRSRRVVRRGGVMPWTAGDLPPLREAVTSTALRALTWPNKFAARLLDLGTGGAAVEVVVDHAHRLHEGITGGGADE